MLIIDISKYNSGTFDWQKVKKSVNGVIIRCGYRGYGSGKIVVDPKCNDFAEYCNKNNIPIGFYFMSQAITIEEAKEEADFTIGFANKYKATLPLFIDSEDGDGTAKVVRADGLPKDLRTKICKAFCDTINKNGYVGGVYASESWFNNRLNYNELKDYFIWVADYGKKNNGTKSSTIELPKYDMHQYTSNGKIVGYSDRIDVSETNYVSKNTSMPTLRYGSRGNAVVELQTILNRLGYDCGKVDGIFGRKTERAVIAFQAFNIDTDGKPLVKDGIVGKKTWGKLL